LHWQVSSLVTKTANDAVKDKQFYKYDTDQRWRKYFLLCRHF